jgi:hypothetical protein
LPTTPVPQTVQLSCVTTSGDVQLGLDLGISGIWILYFRESSKYFGFCQYFLQQTKYFGILQVYLGCAG